LKYWRSVKNDGAILNSDRTPLSNPRNVDDGFGHFTERSSGEVNLPPGRPHNATLLYQRLDNALTNLKCKETTGIESDSITR